MSSSNKCQRHWKLRAAAAFVAATQLVAPIAAIAQVPTASSVISSRASASYTDFDGVTQVATSNVVQTTVQQVGNYEVSPGSTKNASSNAPVAVMHYIENKGNGNDTFRIQVDDNSPAGPGAFASIDVFADADANGLADSTTSLLIGGAVTDGSPRSTGDIAIAAGGRFHYVVVYRLPEVANSTPWSNTANILVTPNNSSLSDQHRQFQPRVVRGGRRGCHEQRRELRDRGDRQQAEGIAVMLGQLRPNWQVQNLVHDRDQLVHSLEEVVPDVLLLDLHMPDPSPHPQDILELVRSTVVPPIVVLITGDPTKALEAYESDVADYVVKPVRPVRLAQALGRAEELLYARRGGRVGTANAAPGAAAVPGSWLSGLRGRDIVLIDPDNIIYLQAERKYTIAYLNDGQALMRFGISDVEAKLDMNAFVRIHRSTIVNIKRIDFLRRDEMGRLRVHMKGRTESLIVSRTFEQTFKGG